MGDAAGELHGFPRVLTSFVGRTDEVSKVAGLLGDYWLVTVTGPGGVGKTRLTGEVAWQVASRFADRARQSDPDFVLDGKSSSAVTQIVSRLGGMPLAIELAAARVEALGVAQLLSRLDKSFGLLTGGDRSADARQRSLAATVDWSYQLLSETERQVFRRLAVFPGPFTLDGAEAVAGDGADVVVIRLVDCSLLSPPQAGPDGRARYLMLETVRDLGLSRLADAGEQPAAAAALARYGLVVAEWAAAEMLTGTQELAAARWLDAEDATVHQALAWALEHDPPGALRLAMALAEWWRQRGRRAAGHDLLKAAARHTEPGSGAWCEAQFWLGDIASGGAEAIGYETAACEVLAARAPSPLLVNVLAGRSRSLAALGQIPEAVQDAHRAQDVARQIGYAGGEVMALAQLSRTALYTGNAAEALQWARQAQQVHSARVPGRMGRKTGDFLAEAMIDSGDAATAKHSAAAGLAFAQESGNLVSQNYYRTLLADVGLRAGDLAGAESHLREATELAARLGQRARLIRCLDLYGHLCSARAQLAEAVTIWAAFAASLDREGIVDLPLRKLRRQEPLRAAVHGLRPGQAHAAEVRGAGMTPETAADFAILQAHQDPQAPEIAGAPGNAGASELSGLSSRERELVTLVAQGATDAQIAGQLFISVSTVRSHLDRIRDKTSCRRRADMTRLTLRAGLV